MFSYSGRKVEGAEKKQKKWSKHKAINPRWRKCAEGKEKLKDFDISRACYALVGLRWTWECNLWNNIIHIKQNEYNRVSSPTYFYAHTEENFPKRRKVEDVERKQQWKEINK